MRNIKKSLGFQTAYQLLSVCMPLITAPYLARNLGAAQLGVFSYTSSIVAYFTLFAMLGTINYGTKSIAAVRTNGNDRNVIFSCIFILQIAVTLVAAIAYGIYLIFICKDNELIAVIQGVAIISCLFDVNWLFWGMENFQITVTRNVVIKLVTVMLILLCVKGESDLWIYTMIMLGGTLISNLILFLYLPRYVSLVKISVSQIKKHIIPNLLLFIPLLAMSVYHTMDKTMLGALSSYEQSGFYYNSDKIVQMPLLIINGIGTVMLPRMSALIGEKKKREADDLFLKTLDGVAFVSIAMACVIASISSEFVPLFFGIGYDACVAITIVFTPILLIKGFSLIVRTQYLIPMGLEKDFTKSVVCGAIINLLLNLILIPDYGAMGATIATVIAELVACTVQFISIREHCIGLKRIFIRTGQYLVVGMLAIVLVRMVAMINTNDVIKIMLEAFVGIVFYVLTCIAVWKKYNENFLSFFIK